MAQSTSKFERRRYDRVALTLSGRYMLADGKEYDCQIVDVSPLGVAIRGPLPGDLGERVIAYFEELGRIEGVIVRRAPDGEWFAVELRVPASRAHKLANRIDWLVRRQREGLPEQRSFQRVDQDQAFATLRLSDGREFEAGVIDVSSGGAALEVDVAPPIGAVVALAGRRARVSRHFAGGIAVAFDADAGLSAKQADSAGTGGPAR